MRVVVRVPLQVEQDQVGHDMVRVPRMVRLLMLILAVGQFFAQQAIMLDIVGRGQLPPSVRHLNGQEHKHDGPEECQQPGVKNDGNDQRLKNFVIQAPDALTTPLKAHLF